MRSTHKTNTSLETINSTCVNFSCVKAKNPLGRAIHHCFHAIKMSATDHGVCIVVRVISQPRSFVDEMPAAS